jgi:hypothetical protein
VTAPTRELLDLGFLINGPFALDIGRAQIARESEQNREHAKNLGIRIGEQFCQLFKACESQEGWESLRGELKLAADATAYDFWDSIYELLVDSIEERSRGDKSAEQLVLDIFWKARNRGAARLYGSCCAIPSRMEGPYRQLVSLPQLRYGIEGLLANDPEIFSVVSKWKVFLDKSPPGTVVCGSRVLKKLKRLATEAGISVPTVRTLDIPMVLDWEFNGDNRSTPDQATRMGEVISKSTLDRMQGEEQEATRKFLKDLQFKGRDDQYHPAKSLLIGHETHWDRDDRLRDERHRAAFAPDHCVLSPEYDGLAIDLFDVSRDALDAPARVMVEWIVQANQISKQQAALNYLAEGELSHELCNELKRRGLEDTWMSDLRGSAAFQSLDETLKGRLLGLIPEEVRPTIDWAPAGVVPRSCRHIEDPAMVLDRLWVWWSSNRDRPQAAFEGRTYLEEYDHQIYPRGTPQLLTSDNSFDDLHCRKGWMTLFLLALMHTMGRTTRQQNRGFLFKCESEGWLDLFASSRWDGDQWLSFVEGYLQDQVEEPQYFHWMRQFVGIFQISKYLDDYIELFLSINRIDSQFCLGEILHPRSSSLHQGGGISPPPLSRVLGIGSCFVVRELFRRGILSSLHAMEHCFVPGRPVRNIFKNLGCELTDPKMRRWDMSRDLWRFAVNHLGPDRASMGRGFDIPFLFLSDNEQLYQQIFQTVDRRDNMLDDEADDIYGY